MPGDDAPRRASVHARRITSVEIDMTINPLFALSYLDNISLTSAADVAFPFGGDDAGDNAVDLSTLTRDCNCLSFARVNPAGDPYHPVRATLFEIPVHPFLLFI